MKHSLIKIMLNKMYQILAVVLTASLLILSVPFVVLATETGGCGSDITWTLEEGVLTLSGSGAMTNFQDGKMAPWYERREEILSIEIEDGITTIGSMAFLECTTIQSVSLPDSITSIGEFAFAGCKELNRVHLEAGLKSIGANAFNRCESLSSIRLPKGLLNIGYQAFYLCESLSSIRIPSTTTNLGESIFAYCTNLTQVILECRINKLPEWTFYGCTDLVDVSMPQGMTEVGEYAFYDCDALEDVYHDGIEDERESISEQIKNDVPGFSGVTEGGSDSIGSTTSESITTDESGSTIKTDKEVAETEDSTIDIEVNHTKPSAGNDVYDVTIDVTIDGKDGWDEMLDYTDSYIRYPDRLSDNDTTVNNVELNVNLNAGTKLPSKVLGSLAGYKVDLSISTGTNASWTIHCEDLNSEDLSGSYDLSFSLTKIDKPTKAQKELIGSATAYRIKFNDNIPFEITIKLPLGYSYATHYATLCQKPILKSWEILQSVVIDRQGLACFYVSSVDKHTDYMAVIDMAGIDAEDILIPDSLSDEYGGLTDEGGNKYVITGTKSSWGISFGQLTLILVGIILVAAVVVGIIVKLQFKLTTNNEQRKRYKHKKVLKK